MNQFTMEEEKPLPPNAPRPRMCHVTKWDDFDGYGFNLHAEKCRPGQFIGQVDEGSPAAKAGLREGDKIIEVNGVNINQENHKQVVQRIKATSDETRLLVVDQHADKFYKDNGIVLHGSMENVWCQSSDPDQKQSSPEDHRQSLEESQPDTSFEVPTVQRSHSATESKHTEDESDSIHSSGSVPSVENDKRMESNHQVFTKTSAGSSSRGSTPSPSPKPLRSLGGLDLSMTAAEMRSRIGSKKKRDPRRDDRMDFRRKFEIIETL